MIALKLDSKLQGSAVVSLQELASALFASPGMRVMAIVELAHIERVEPATGEDKDPVVKVAMKAIEVARGDQDEILRRAAAALHRHRTSTGTLDEEWSPQLSQTTVERLQGLDGHLEAVEAARLRTLLEQLGDYIDRVTRGSLTKNQAIEELQTVRKGISAGLYWGQS